MFSKNGKNKWEHYTGIKIDQISWWIASHPVEYVHTLMKIGYEPIPPIPDNCFGETCLALPNTYIYLKYIFNQEGLRGLYQGFAPNICVNVVRSIFMHNFKWPSSSIPNILQDHHEHRYDEDFPIPRHSMPINPLKITSLSPAPSFSNLIKSTGRQIMTVSIGTIASHPFHVISVRMMAQFVGREVKYISVWSSLKAILEESGILGLFKGLVPRLMGENLRVIIPAAAFFITTKICGNRHIVNTCTSISRILSERFAYQFDVVSATMIVENSSMAIGQAPFIKRKFSNWLDLWEHLKTLNVQNRGRSAFFRYYCGPTVQINGEIKPMGVYFGPFCTS